MNEVPFKESLAAVKFAVIEGNLTETLLILLKHLCGELFSNIVQTIQAGHEATLKEMSLS